MEQWNDNSPEEWIRRILTERSQRLLGKGRLKDKQCNIFATAGWNMSDTDQTGSASELNLSTLLNAGFISRVPCPLQVCPVNLRIIPSRKAARGSPVGLPCTLPLSAMTRRLRNSIAQRAHYHIGEHGLARGSLEYKSQIPQISSVTLESTTFFDIRAFQLRKHQYDSFH